MQFNLKLFVLSALIGLVASSPTTSPAAGASGNTSVSSSKCKTGPIQCCQTVQKASEDPVAGILGVLNIPVQDVNVPIGLTCDPISVVGIGGTNCASQPVCCKENNFNGLVAVGCTPINLGL